MSVERKRAPRGPRGDRGETLARIRRAARASFAVHGWEGTSLRAIAREVGVDPALVHYYFSSKEELLDAVDDAARGVARVDPRDQRALRCGRGARRSCETSSGPGAQPDIREVLESTILTAAHEPRTREKLRTFLTASLLPSVAERIEGEERLVRASLIGSQVVGVVMLRYVWRIEPIASLPDDAIWSRWWADDPALPVRSLV